MTPKRITIISLLVPPAHSGAGKVSSWLAENLAQHGEKVRVLTETRSPSEINGVEFVCLLTGRVRNLSIKRFVIGRLILKWFMGMVALFESTRLLRDQCDLIIIIGLSPVAEMFGLVGQLMGLQIAYQPVLIGDDDPSSLRRSFLGEVRWRCVKGGSRFIAITPAMAEGYVKNGGSKNKLSLIPNPVALDSFYIPSLTERRKLRLKLGLDYDAKIILTVGRVCPRKGTSELVSSCLQDIFPNVPNSQLVVVGPLDSTNGETQYYDQIKQSITDSNFRGRVSFRGQVEDPAEYFRAADIFALPSKSEGFGIVFIEALASGLPVVALEIPGVTDYIFPSIAGAYIINAEQEISRALLSALNAASDPLVKKALRAHAAGHFSALRISARYIEVFS